MKIKPIVAALLTLTSFSSAAATYSITPIPVASKAKNAFANSIDNAGVMLVTTGNEYNPPIDVERLKQTDFFATNAALIESEEDIKNGIFSDIDYTLIVNYLLNDTNFVARKQRIANFKSYATDLIDTDLIQGFDNYVETFDDLSNSVTTIARDSLDSDFIVGYSESPFKDVEYTNSSDNTVTYTVNDIYRRGFVQVGSKITSLLPENALANGVSEAFAVNNQFQVVGYGSTRFASSIRESIANCSDDETRGNVPEEFCLYGVINSGGFRSNASIRATVWQLDANGEVVSRETYPLLFEPENNNFSSESRMLDINNNGIAVGWSHTGKAVRILFPGSQVATNVAESKATYFANGETVSFLTEEENLTSIANSINDNGWITGAVFRAPNEVARERLFIHNINSNQTRYPEGFFVNAGVKAFAINNNNIVVGKGDIETSNERNRETHAFMYKIESDEFIDLNLLTKCDTPYTLIEAVDINDNNEIIANARYVANDTYATGKAVQDQNGENVTRDKIIAVKLSPVANGQIESCEKKEEQKYERSGASGSLLSLLGGLALVFIRRKYK